VICQVSNADGSANYSLTTTSLQRTLALHCCATASPVARISIASTLSYTFFQKASLKRIDYSKRAANHISRQIVQPDAICVFCVNLLVSAFKTLLCDAANAGDGHVDQWCNRRVIWTG
jgi:hypothetical protein